MYLFSEYKMYLFRNR